jgi:WD40 repeat protein
MISPNGRTLLIHDDRQTPTRDDDTVQLLALDGDPLIGTLPEVSPEIFSDSPYPDAKYNPDGSILVTGQPKLQFWRSADAGSLGVDEATTGEENVIFINDGNTAVIFKNEVYKYEIRSFPASRTLGQLGIPHGWQSEGSQVGQQFDALAFSADWHFVATPGRGGTVTLWDLRAGRQLPHLSGHTESTIKAEFAKDNCRLVTASNDDTVRVWALPCR